MKKHIFPIVLSLFICCCFVSNRAESNPTYHIKVKARVSDSSVICRGDSVTLSASVCFCGIPPYTYSWSPSAGLKCANCRVTKAAPSSTTVYTITVTDNNAVSGTTTITVHVDSMHVTITGGNICPGFTGSLTATVSGSNTVPPYTYNWSSTEGTNSTATGLSAGTYTLTVTDSSGCSLTKSYILNTSTTPTVTASVTSNVSSNGGSDGNASASVSGGTSPYIYSWSGGGTNSTYTGLTAGTYTITLTDSCGATASASVTLTQPLYHIIPKAYTSDTLLCNGDSVKLFATVCFCGIPPYTYSWNPSTGLSCNTCPKTKATPTTTITYTITVTDNHGVSGTASIRVRVDNIGVTISGGNVCPGSTRSLTATVTGSLTFPPYTYSWSPSGGTNPTATGLSAGTYTLTVNDSYGCSVTKADTINTFTPPSVSATAVSSSVCAGSPDSLKATITGGVTPYTFSWAPTATLSCDSCQNPIATPLSTTTYTVTVTDNHGCTGTAAIEVNTCGNSCSNSCLLTSNGCKDNVSLSSSILWFSFTATANTQTLIINNPQDTLPGRVTRVVLDSGSCGSLDSIAGGTFDLESSNKSLIIFHTAGLIVGKTYYTKLYVDMPIDSRFFKICQSLQNSTDNCPSEPPPCDLVTNGNFETMNACPTMISNIYQYPNSDVSCWYSPDDRTPDYYNSCAVGSSSGGCEACVPTNESGCAFPHSGNGYAGIVAMYAYRTYCNNEYIQQNLTNPMIAGATYNVSYWVQLSNGSTESVDGSSMGLFISVNQPNTWGAYCSELLDPDNGNNPISLPDPRIITAALTPAFNTPSTWVNITGTYLASGNEQWITIGDFNSSTTITTLTGAICFWTGAGVDGANMTPYYYIDDVSITSLIVTVPVPTTICTSVSHSVNLILSTTGGTSPYNYSWTPSTDLTCTSCASPTASPTVTTTYTVTVTDANGCTASTTELVTVDNLSASASTTANVTCNGRCDGSGSSTASDGTVPYHYTWSTGGSNATKTGLCAGTYTVTVTDNNICRVTASTTITQPAPLSVSASINNIRCNGGSNGSATVTVSGGTTSYTYSWSNSGTTATISGLSPGIYTVTITDYHGCTATKSATITEPAPLTIAAIPYPNVSCYGGSNGEVRAYPLHGTAPYSFSWSNGVTTSINSGLTAGTYTVYVTDNCGATATASAIITQPVPLTAGARTYANISCYGGSNGVVSASPLGGSGVYSYSWAPGGGTSYSYIKSGLTAGTYTVTIKDIVCGTTATATATVTQPSLLTVSISGNNMLCSSATTSTLTATVSGGISPYDYSWSPTGGTSSTATLTIGTYTVTVTDVNGCTTTATYNIQSCCGDPSGFTFVIGDKTPYSSASSLSSSVFVSTTILVNGIFTVDQATSFSGCDVQFTPNSEIIILAGETLSIGSCSHLHAACDKMWQGIIINSGGTLIGPAASSTILIEDAIQAVLALNTSTLSLFQLNDVVFNKCWEGIVIDPTTLNFNLNNATSCVFTCRDLSSFVAGCSWDTYSNWNSASGSTLLYPYSGNISNTGIQVTGVNHLPVGWSNFYFCYFDNLWFGVYSTASNIGVFGDIFQNMHNLGATGVYEIGLTTGSGNALQVGGNPVLKRCTFTNCCLGVLTQNLMSKVIVLHNDFTNSTSTPGLFDIMVMQSGGGNLSLTSKLVIQNNNINNADVGILTYNNIQTNADISCNTITYTPCLGIKDVGIYVDEILSPPPPNAIYNVHNNLINITNYVGINANDIANSYINANGTYSTPISLGDASCSVGLNFGTGIQFVNGNSTQIANNYIAVPNNSYGWPFTAIFESQSPSSDIRCNTIYNPTYQIKADGAASGVSALKNFMNAGLNTAAAGLVTTNGATFTDGNGSTYADNNWIGTFSCRTDETLGSTEVWDGSAATNPDVTPGCNWPTRIRISSGSNPTCPEIGRCGSELFLALDSLALDSVVVDSLAPPFYYAPDSITIALMHSVVLKHDTFENQDTMQAIADEGVVKILWSNPYLISSDAILQHFMDSIKTKPLGEIMAIDTMIYKVTSSSDFSALLTSVNSLAPVNNIETNMQAATAFYLNYKINNDTLSVTQIGQLRNIAKKCPDIDGPGVYEARALIMVFDTAGTMYSDTSCGHGLHRAIKKNEKTVISATSISDIGINIYPNPNNGSFTLEYQFNEVESTNVILYTTLGEKVGEYNLKGSEGKMNITNYSLSNGVYFYKVFSNNNQVLKIGKVIIIK